MPAGAGGWLGATESRARNRARGLGIKHVFQGVDDKLAALKKLAKTLKVSLEDCACVGDDTPDAPILNACGLGIAVADAHPDALAAADLETTRAGGHGAVREASLVQCGIEPFTARVAGENASGSIRSVRARRIEDRNCFASRLPI